MNKSASIISQIEQIKIMEAKPSRLDNVETVFDMVLGDYAGVLDEKDEETLVKILKGMKEIASKFGIDYKKYDTDKLYIKYDDLVRDARG